MVGRTFWAHAVQSAVDVAEGAAVTVAAAIAVFICGFRTPAYMPTIAGLIEALAQPATTPAHGPVVRAK